MYCNKCGREIEENARFCFYCGSCCSELSSDTDMTSQKRNKSKSFRIYIMIPIFVLMVIGGCLIYFISNSLDSETFLQIQDDSEQQLVGKTEKSQETEKSKGVESTKDNGQVDEAVTSVTITDEQKEMFEEVIPIIPFKMDGLSDLELADSILLGLLYSSTSGENISTIPLTLYKEENEIPFECSICMKSKGEMVTHEYIEIAELQDFCKQVFGEKREFLTDLSCINSNFCICDGRIEEWDYHWYIVFEGVDYSFSEYTYEINNNGMLEIRARYTLCECDSSTDYAYVSLWKKNPDSYLGYTLESQSRELLTDRADDYVDLDTTDKVEKQRKLIKEWIDTGETESMITYPEENGTVWIQQNYYHNGELVFSYWSQATNGMADRRFYLKDGKLFRYIEGTSPNQNQYDICDGKNDLWDTWEQEVLQSDRR